MASDASVTAVKRIRAHTAEKRRQCHTLPTGLMLIENTDLSISEIGYRVGYSYPASFTQAIRKHYGKTPQALRSGN